MAAIVCSHCLEFTVSAIYFLAQGMLTLCRDGSTNVSSLPLACPQPNLDPSLYTEDCLSMVLYVPPSLNLQSAVPTLVWCVLYFYNLLPCSGWAGFTEVHLSSVLLLQLVWMVPSLQLLLILLWPLSNTV